MNAASFRSVAPGSLSLSIVLFCLAGCGGAGSNLPSTSVDATITWPAPAAIPYGTALSATQLNATANTPGTFIYQPALGTVPTAGAITLNAIFLPTYPSSYLSASAAVTLTVGKVTPTITWPAPATISTLTPLGNATLDATASLPGTLVYTPALGTFLAAGAQMLSVTFTPTDTVDYNTVTQTATVNVVAGVPSYTWNSVRVVAGGFITGIVAHPAQANLRYARTDIGGAYRWDPVNAIWVPLLDFLTSAQDNLLGVESIGLDPTNPQKLYLACGTYAAESFAGNGAMLLSSNQGASFTIVNVPFKIGSNDSGRHAGERLAVDPNQPSTLYFGSRLSGLWRSTNSGASWSQVASFPVTGTTSGVGIVFVDFVAASGTSGSATPVIYAGVSDGGATPTNYATLYRSTDAGSTWQPVPGAPASLAGLYVSHGVLGPDGAMYLSYSNAPGPTGISAGALWQYVLPSSPTGAGTWNNITVGAPARPSYAQGGFGAIAVDPERPGVLMASTMDDYNPSDDIYRSTNFGATWVSLNAQGKSHNYTLSPWLSYHQPQTTATGTGNWPGTLLVDPFNSNHFLYGNGQTLWDSANIQVSDIGQGPSFSIGALGIEEESISTLLSPAAGALLLSGMGDITGMVHTDVKVSPASGMAGTTATSKIVSYDYAQNVPLTVVLAAVGGAAYATDGGVTSSSWKNMTTPSGSTAAQGSIAIAADASVIVWATSDGPVAYSTNNGSTWTPSTGAITQSQVLADRINPKKFYILSGATLQISTDGGHTFANVMNSLPNYGVLAVSPAAEGDLWVAAGASLMHSTNNGMSFSSVSGLTSVSMISFGAAISSAAYPAIYAIANGSSGTGFYRSINGGATWIYMNDAAHQYAYTPWIAGDPKLYGRVYIGTNGRGIIYGDSPF